MLAMELSTSIFCDRLIRGTMSMAITVAPLALAWLSSSSLDGIEEGDERLSLPQAGDLLPGGRAHLGHDLGRGPERVGIRHHLDTGFGISGVGEAGRLASRVSTAEAF